MVLLLLATVQAKEYAQIVVIDEPYQNPNTIYYLGSQNEKSSYQRGYHDGFDDGYSTGYVNGVDHGRNSPYNRRYSDCDTIDDWDDWEDCATFYPGIYPLYSYPAHYAVPMRSQYSYAPTRCAYRYQRYC